MTVPLCSGCPSLSNVDIYGFPFNGDTGPENPSIEQSTGLLACTGTIGTVKRNFISPDFRSTSADDPLAKVFSQKGTRPFGVNCDKRRPVFKETEWIGIPFTAPATKKETVIVMFVASKK